MTTTSKTATTVRYAHVRGPAKNPYQATEHAATVQVGRLQDGKMQISLELIGAEGKRLVVRADAATALNIASRLVSLMTNDEYQALLNDGGAVSTDIRLLREGTMGLVDEVLAARRNLGRVGGA